MKLINTTSLWYKKNESDKVYHVHLIKNLQDDYWNVEFAYGRRFTNLKQGIKNNTTLSYNKAKDMYEKLIKSKEKKGYSIENTITHNIDRVSFYKKFVMKLLNEGKLSEKESIKILKLLISNDPESTNLAEILIETKEQEKWVQV